MLDTKTLCLMIRTFYCIYTLFFLSSFSGSFQDPVIGNWKTDDNRYIINVSEIRPGLLEGRILWMCTPKDKFGKLIKDIANPEPSKRNKALLGNIVIRNLKYNKVKGYDGLIYHPKTGKSYHVSIYSNEHQILTLVVKGSFFTKTLKWVRQE